MANKDTVRALLRSAMATEDIVQACQYLTQARVLQPLGLLGGSYGFVVDGASPQAYYAHRKRLIEEDIAAGVAAGMLPKIQPLAEKFNCCLSVVHKIRTDWQNRQARVAGV